MQNAAELLRKSGIRLTNGRLFVLQAIEKLAGHRPDASDIFRELHGNGSPVSMGNVYRVLREMVEQGILKRAWGRSDGEPRYFYRIASAVDPDGSIRMICIHCGERASLESPQLFNAIRRAGKNVGLEPSASPLSIELTCSNCAAQHRPLARKRGVKRTGQK